MLATFIGVGQHFIGGVDDRHNPCCFSIIGVSIWVKFLRECSVGCTDDLRRSIARHLEIVIVGMYLSHEILILTFDFSGCLVSPLEGIVRQAAIQAFAHVQGLNFAWLAKDHGCLASQANFRGFDLVL